MCTLQQPCLSCSEEHCRMVVNSSLWIKSHSLTAVVVDMVQPLLELETEEYTWYVTNGVPNVLFLTLWPEKQDSRSSSPRTSYNRLGTSCPCEEKRLTICHGIIHETLARHLWRTFSLCWWGTYWSKKPRRKTKQRRTDDHCLVQIKFRLWTVLLVIAQNHILGDSKMANISLNLGDLIVQLLLSTISVFLILFSPWYSSPLRDWRETWIQSRKNGFPVNFCFMYWFSITSCVAVVFHPFQRCR